ncbi:MAG: SIS domain-containing protein [Anaerolineae bacterium]|nr:SIS domain-containing protein [Anaerolineae bacterium]
MNNSILYQEISEQPAVIRRLVNNERKNIEDIADSIRSKFSYIYIAARGSSDNAARYAQYLFGIHNHLTVGLATPSIFSLYQEPPLLKDALVIGISQSGQSPDILSVIKVASEQGCPTIALTNDSSSPLANAATFVINLQAHQERAVAATKTYTASLTALAMLSVLLNEHAAALDNIAELPGWIENTIEETKGVIPRVERFRYMEHCAVLGRGYNYATSFEISLKIKEINRIIAEPYSTADFRHGPISTIHPGFPVFIIANEGPTFKDTANLVSGLVDLGAEIILVSNANIPNLYPVMFFHIPTEVPEWLSPIPSVIPGQLFAMQLALERGLDPDFPAGLGKVTQTY